MKLAILNLTNGSISGGYKKYLNNILPRICKVNIFSEINLFVSQQMLASISESPGSRLVWPESDYKRGFPWIRNHLAVSPPDVIFIPTARSFQFEKAPVVIMIRNMEPLTIPYSKYSLTESIKNLARYCYAKKATQKADRVIAVSKHVRAFVIDRWGLSPDRIGVVYHGISPRNVSEGICNSGVAGFISGQQQFIFTAGSIRSARGLEDLIAAFSIVYKMNPELRLVIAGSLDLGMGSYKEALDATIKDNGCGEVIFWAGKLTEQEMIWCYQKCSAFVMTSRTEACPNIVLEAMVNGCVCISTRTSPMPEFFRDSALYYSPHNGEELSRVLKEVLLWECHKKKSMSDRAKRRSQDFSWDICAERTIMELQKAVNKTKAPQSEF